MELEYIGLVSKTIAFIAFDIDGNIFDDTKGGNYDLSFLCFVKQNQSFLSFAILEPKIRCQIESFA